MDVHERVQGDFQARDTGYDGFDPKTTVKYPIFFVTNCAISTYTPLTAYNDHDASIRWHWRMHASCGQNAEKKETSCIRSFQPKTLHRCVCSVISGNLTTFRETCKRQITGRDIQIIRNS